MTAGRPLVAVVGPTAAGKSDLAVAVALELAGEVINADSMQLYRGMDIGTAKLSQAQRRGVPHHLLDVWDVDRTATVAEYQELALTAIADIRSRGRLPVLVGGSGLYVQAVTDRWAFPGTDPQARKRLEADLAEVGPQQLHARLAALDPAAARAILPSNGRRIVRALEVVGLRGRFTATLPRPSAGDHAEDRRDDVVLIGLDLPRDVLDARIASRVEAMWRAGLVAEVQALEHGLRRGTTAPRALGYAQLLRHLDGDLTEEQAKEATVAATLRFARRQAAWFRRDPRIHWLPFDAADLVSRAVAVVGARPPAP